MGISWSGGRHRNNSDQNHPTPRPPPTDSSSSFTIRDHYFRPPPPPPPAGAPSAIAQPSNSTWSTHQPSQTGNIGYADSTAYPPTSPPPPQTQYSSVTTHANSTIGRSHYHPYHIHHSNECRQFRPSPSLAPALPPPSYVDHENAKNVKNEVNIHKDTVKLEVDSVNPDHHLVSFVFDTLCDGSITIMYFAKEETQCKFVPLYPEAFKPVIIPFQKGHHQKFIQTSGSGIDLGFFELDELSKPASSEDIFPLVICAETSLTSKSADESLCQPMPDASANKQITQAIIEKKNSADPFGVKVIKQILWIEGVRYELRELYGIGNSATKDFSDNDPGKECAICMTEPKDTAALPCRHLCMCSECAKALRRQSNNCPICRQPIEELIEIKINSGD